MNHYKEMYAHYAELLRSAMEYDIVVYTATQTPSDYLDVIPRYIIPRQLLDMPILGIIVDYPDTFTKLFLHKNSVGNNK